MSGFSSLRVRLVGTVFLAIAPALVFLYFSGSPWIGFAVGLLALIAAWFGGERFVLQRLQMLVAAVRRFSSGDLSVRTGLADERDEIGQLAHAFDSMAASLEQRNQEREKAEHDLFNRAHQQTAVAALGQFALTSGDFSALLNQAVMLAAQTLEIEFCRVLELLPDHETLLLRAGIGWRNELVGMATVDVQPDMQLSHILASGEPVVIEDSDGESRLRADPMLAEHQVVSGITVGIIAGDRPFGLIGVYSPRKRSFTNDDVQFLLSVANALAVAVGRRSAEAELKQIAGFAQLNPNPGMELSANGAITFFNEAALNLARLIGQGQPRAILPADVAAIFRKCLSGGEKVRAEAKVEGRVLAWTFHPVPERQAVHCYAEDITERLSLEAQFRQAQKMESVGQLAAGVAHDFNNLLTVIQGHAAVLLARPQFPPEFKDSLQAVYYAAERAAGLTRQLLMFSRKSVMQPRLLDLGQVIGNMTKMLRRLLGETVTLEFNPPSELPLVNGDTGMMEQVIMNLAVNARDAMPMGGRLSISLEPLNLDESQARLHAEARPGAYVRLRVGDTGTGMDAATKSRIFEPFFTTKEAGKGTGLGLATVYGVVKQQQGWIEVASEEGRGTAFSIFFPAAEPSGRVAREPNNLGAQVRGGTETILLVEDERAVLTMGRIILEDCGYSVIEALSGVEALGVFDSRGEEIDLLLTDMVMPQGISGLELAQRLLARRPDLPVLFTSGYSVEDLGTDFIQKGSGTFLQKPYTRSTLAKAVRRVLDDASRATVSAH